MPERDIDYILMLDSDILFETRQVLRLLEHKLDFVSGYYVYAGEETKPYESRLVAAGTWDEDFFRQHKHFPTLRLQDLQDKSDLVQVDWLGLGFCVVKREVFQRIKYPWFASEKIRVGKIVDTTSEDVGFCRKLSKAGIPIWLDPQVKVGHLKTVVL